jgi:peptidyl-prolyl cis-trans isomerase B (cyclophilin B)
VVLQTSAGKITLELDPKASPLTVENFLHYVERGHYDQTIFHQVVDGYVLVGGSYDASLQEKPADATIRNEAHNGVSNARGTVAMARSPEAIDSSTRQFFINLANNSELLDHKGSEPEQYGYCVFGRVVEGLEVCDKIAKGSVHTRDSFEMLPVETVMIESARRVR